MENSTHDLRFVTDVHVPKIFTDLFNREYVVHRVQDLFGRETDDPEILEMCGEKGLVVVTNDRDFKRLHDEGEIRHGGVIIYIEQRFLRNSPGKGVGAINRINRFYSPEEIRNNIEWLENWVEK